MLGCWCSEDLHTDRDTVMCWVDSTSVRGRSRHQMQYSPDLPQSNGPRAISMRALDATTCGGTLTRRPSNWDLLRRSAARGSEGSLLRPAAARFTVSALQQKALVSESLLRAATNLAIFLACSLAASLPFLCTVGYGVMMTNTDGR
jgi:hypothetical protein